MTNTTQKRGTNFVTIKSQENDFPSSPFWGVEGNQRLVEITVKHQLSISWYLLFRSESVAENPSAKKSERNAWDDSAFCCWKGFQEENVLNVKKKSFRNK
jgi:hypothetical protein